MSLEEALDRNTAALEKHTAALQGGTTGATATPPRRGRPPGSGSKGPTVAEVKAVAERVRDERSRAEAIALLKKHGAEKVAELDESKYAAFVAAAEVLLATDEGGDAGEGDDI